MDEQVLRLGERRAVRLIEVLGEGGFGVVWRGELTGAAGLVKAVAVKVLNRSAADVPELASRMRDEARMLALLRHRAIVGVDDLVEVDGRWALVMEYVSGVDLHRLIEHAPLPARPACEVLLEAASALQSAHGATHPGTGERLELVHRDIKPANLRITSGGEVKLLDFGIARARFDTREATTREMSFGSVGYMAPERWEGREGPPVDVYALGVVGIEALSGKVLGQLPVEAGRHAARLHVAVKEIEGIPDELRELLSAMVDYFPEERPTASEVVRRLRGIVVLADGPWLADWAPGALAALPAEVRAVGSAEGNTPTFAQRTPGDDPTRWSRGEVASPPPKRASESPGDPVTADLETTGGGAFKWVALLVVATALFAAVVVVGAAGLGGAAWFYSGAPDPEAASAPASTEPVESHPRPEPEVAVPADAVPAAPPEETEAPDATPVPAPRPKAVPAPVTVAAPAPDPIPAPVLLGELVVDAEGIHEVRLVGTDGQSHYPGAVPADTYVARVTFTDGVSIRVEGVVVRAAQATTLKCSALAQTCLIR